MMDIQNMYKGYRQNFNQSPIQIISFSRQLISLAEAELAMEKTRLQIEQKNLLAKRREQKESDPWDDAPGIILEGIQPS